jgi:hypothetical protein
VDGDFTQTLSGTLAIEPGGRADGPLDVHPDFGGSSVDRERIDRSLNVALVRSNDARTVSHAVSYTHLRQASRIFGPYDGNFNYTGHGLHVAQDWAVGRTALRAEIGGDYIQYDYGYDKVDRLSGTADIKLAHLSSDWRFAANAGQQYVEGLRFLPNVAAVLFRDSERLFLTFSVGYTEIAPTLHELHLPFSKASLYGTNTLDYADRGNPNLTTEKQLVANAAVEIGRPDNSLGLSVTGGRIFDGIDWQNQLVNDSFSIFTQFSPINGDIDFVSGTLTKKIRIAEFLRFSGGGSYHYLDYAAFDDKAYSPEYQLFSGMELHVFWRQRLIHLYAYGEVVYTGPYHGYFEDGLGEVPIFNIKLSFKARSFRFHYVVQNALAREYRARDYFTNPGRYDYYGFTWDFLN